MKENASRRNALFELMEEGSLAIVFSGVAKLSGREDETLPFFANNNFFYLTNVKQENSVLIIVKGIDGEKDYLFVDEYDEVKEKWYGKKLTYDEAKELSDITNVYPNRNLESMIDLVLTKENNQYGNINKIYIDLTPELKIKDSYSTKDFAKSIEEKYPGHIIENVEPLITKLRMVKSEYELKQMKEAISLTNSAICYCLNKLDEKKYEYEVANDFAYYGVSHGRHCLAFDSIIASGVNATILHYPQQVSKIGKSNLILFDVGLDYNGYSADISRTYPLSGKFVGDQKLIYTAVLNCNKAVIEYSRAGLTIKDLQAYASEFLKNECVRLGLLKPEDDIRRVYYHGVSHHLGLGTHDASNRELPLEAGNVITVEPGLYFKEKGIGVRVEDDVLITDGKSIVLSKDIVKEIDDIEALLATKK